MSRVLKSAVTIKGMKDALLFFLDDGASFSAILQELKYKLEHHKYAHLWDGPKVNVRIKLGDRQISRVEESAVRSLFASRPNLTIVSFDDDKFIGESITSKKENEGIQIITGMIRSGQVLDHKGDLLLLGDINPGGVVRSTGSIYVLGSIKGVAHAGSNGDEQAIISASILKPTQLRIANTIASLLSTLEQEDYVMCFAYLTNRQIILDKLSNLMRVRPDIESTLT